MEPARRFRKIYWLGAIAAALLAAGAVHNELLGPVIRAVPIAAPDPLTVRFAIFNPAFTVTLKDVDMTCLPESLRGHAKGGRLWSAAARPFPLDVDIDLKPRMAFEYTCPIKSAGIEGPVDAVTANIAIRYTRFGRRGRAISRVLTWNSVNRVWTEAGR